MPSVTAAPRPARPRLHRHGHLAAAGRAGRAGRSASAPATVAGRRFILGEPMKPATNRLRGVVVKLQRRADLLDHAAPAARRSCRPWSWPRPGRGSRRSSSRPAPRAGARARCASARARRRRGWTAARRTGTPWARARSPGRWRRAGAGRRRAPSGGGPDRGRAAGCGRRRATLRSRSSFDAPASCSAKAMLSAHGHMRVERVGLEDHREAAVGRADVVARRRRSAGRRR